MLYEINGGDDALTLKPVAFGDFASQGGKEKDLEDLLATLLEQVDLMLPIRQERPWQGEADLYALDVHGDLVIFELKRSQAGADAVQQVLRYAQDAGLWQYGKLEQCYRQYTGGEQSLAQAHREAFGLDEALSPDAFNRRQRFYVTGSAADDGMVRAVDYWKRQGLAIDFIPYRLYEIEGKRYLEFFAPPYDSHRNPADAKGVLFDTNRTYDEESIWYMMENSVVAAWGDATRFLKSLNPGDYVFYCHRWEGVVAAGKVKQGGVKAPDDETRYREVELLTPAPRRGEPYKALPFRQVQEIVGHGFYWARTIKVPHLSRQESEALLEAMRCD